MRSSSRVFSESTRSFFLQEIGGKGQGVFTLRHHEAGEKILYFKGNIVDLDDVEDHGKYLQVGKHLFLGSSGELDDFINHSCEPNCGVALRQGKILLISISEIQPKEELTFDYSTWMAYDYWEMDCLCGNTHCRKKIKDFKYLPRELRQNYIDLNVVPDYVLRENQFRLKC
jgi:SET domain-containing protein